jgi:hypothetical protein
MEYQRDPTSYTPMSFEPIGDVLSSKNPGFLQKLRELQPIGEQQKRELSELVKQRRVQELIDIIDKSLVKRAKNGLCMLTIPTREFREEGVLNDIVTHYRALGFTVTVGDVIGMIEFMPADAAVAPAAVFP